MEPTIYKIPKPRVADLLKAFERMKRSAEKRHTKPPVLNFHGTEVVQGKGGAMDELHLYSLTSEAPTEKGWRFIAALEHKPAGNIIRALGGEDVPDSYRKAPARCDHCGQNRRRRDTYVVRFGDTFDFKQVGSACLAEFLGETDPAERVAYFAGLVRKADETLNSYTVYTGEPYLISAQVFMAYVKQVVEEYGWVPNSKADDANPSTRSRAVERLYRELGTEASIRQEDLEWAASALAWGAKQADFRQNDYMHNLAVLCKTPGVETRDLGLLASLYQAYTREMERNRPQPEAGKGHFGEVGKRDVFELTLESVRTSQGQFGTKYIHNFRDKDRNLAVWFCSASESLQPGRVYKIRATVKDHGEFRGEPQTVLSRCVEV